MLLDASVSLVSGMVLGWIVSVFGEILCNCWMARLGSGGWGQALDLDLMFAPSGLGDFVGGLHAHEGGNKFWETPRDFFGRRAISPERAALPLSWVEMVGQVISPIE